MPVDFSPKQPSLADFQTAARLGEKKSVRLNESGDGVATTQWARLEVKFYDMFRNADEIAAKKTETLTAFLDAIYREQSADMSQLAEAHLTRHHVGDNAPLRGRTVESTCTLLASQGRANWLHNEQAIRQVTYGTQVLSFAAEPQAASDPHATVPSFRALVEPTATALIGKERTLGIVSNAELDSLEQKYAGKCWENSYASVNRDFPRLSRAIEQQLRAFSRTIGDDSSIALKRLDADSISRQGELAVKQVITSEINQLRYQHFNAAHPLDADSVGRPVPEAQLRQFAEIEKQDATQTQDYLLDEAALQARRDKLVQKISSHAAAIAHVDDYQLPESPARTDLYRTCLTLPSSISEDSLARVEDASEKLDALVRQLSSGSLTPEQQKAAFLKFGQTLVAHIAARADRNLKGAEDVANFATLVADLFAARAERSTLATLKQWMHSGTGKKMQKEIGDLVYSHSGDITPEIEQAIHLNFVFPQLEQLLATPESS